MSSTKDVLCRLYIAHEMCFTETCVIHKPEAFVHREKYEVHECVAFYYF